MSGNVVPNTTGAARSATPQLAKDYSHIAPHYDSTRYLNRKARFTSACEIGLLRETVLRYARRRGRLIDVACGTGNFTHPVAELFQAAVGVDLTSAMLRQALEKSGNPPRPHTPRFVQASATELPIAPESADVVLSTRFLHLFPRREHPRLLGILASLVKPGGILIVDHDSPVLEGLSHAASRLKGHSGLDWSSFDASSEIPAALRPIARSGVSAPGLPTLSLVLPRIARGLASGFARAPFTRLSTFIIVVYEKR